MRTAAMRVDCSPTPATPATKVAPRCARGRWPAGSAPRPASLFPTSAAILPRRTPSTRAGSGTRRPEHPRAGSAPRRGPRDRRGRGPQPPALTGTQAQGAGSARVLTSVVERATGQGHDAEHHQARVGPEVDRSLVRRPHVPVGSQLLVALVVRRLGRGRQHRGRACVLRSRGRPPAPPPSPDLHQVAVGDRVEQRRRRSPPPARPAFPEPGRASTRRAGWPALGAGPRRRPAPPRWPARRRSSRTAGPPSAADAQRRTRPPRPTRAGRAERAQGLEHPVASRPVELGHHHRGVHEPAEQGSRVAVEAEVACHPLGGNQVEAVHEHREVPEERLLLGVEEVVGPRTRRAQRPVSQLVAGSATEQVQRPVEPTTQVRDRERREAAAASSIARGIPSTRRTMSATAIELATRAGRDVPARTVEEHGHRRHPGEVVLVSGTGSGPRRTTYSSRKSQGLTAGDEDGQLAGTRRASWTDQAVPRSSRCSQLSTSSSRDGRRGRRGTR